MRPIFSILLQILLSNSLNAVLISGTYEASANLARQYPAVGSLKSDLGGGTASLVKHKNNLFLLTAAHCLVDEGASLKLISADDPRKEPETIFAKMGTHSFLDLGDEHQTKNSLCMFEGPASLTLPNARNITITANKWLISPHEDVAIADLFGLIDPEALGVDIHPSNEGSPESNPEKIFVGASKNCGSMGTSTLYDANGHYKEQGMIPADGPLAGKMSLEELNGKLATTEYTETLTNEGDSGGALVCSNKVLGILSETGGQQVIYERAGRIIKTETKPRSHFSKIEDALPLFEYALQARGTSHSGPSTGAPLIESKL